MMNRMEPVRFGPNGAGEVKRFYWMVDAFASSTAVDNYLHRFYH